MFIYRCQVRSSWLDANRHMNARRHFEVFSDASDLACHDLGLGLSYIQEGHSVFTGDFHITYVREIPAGTSLTIATRIVDLDAKRFVLHQEMVDDRNQMLAATAEQLQLNVGTASRKVEPFRTEVFTRLRDAQHNQDSRPPRNVGRAASLAAGAPAR
ncbi:thioesterase family protein [Bradyrhizobium centrolobii]|nr:thioesterase family protein [Bradyrhizobium centrolobii]